MTKTMRKVRGWAGVVAVSAIVAATVGTSTTIVRAAAQETRRTSTAKGVIKSLDDNTVVIVPAENKKGQVTFKVTSATTKSGAVASGDEVTVTYHFEQGQRVASALAGKAK